MNTPPRPPKFRKVLHHVVPAGWQRKFAGKGQDGPYYRNVITGENRGPEGPGQKMAEPYANTIFDPDYRPSDALEDALERIETKALPALDRLNSTGVLDTNARADVAYLLAVQACRYPELYATRLDLGRYLAITLKDCAKFENAAAMNEHLRRGGFLPEADFTDTEFHQLSNASKNGLASELDTILSAHGYEALFNPSLVLAAAMPVAEHLLALQWDLLQTAAQSFILSDRPMPTTIGHEFFIGLTAGFGLKVSPPAAPIHDGAICSRPATQAEVDTINSDVRSRAREWLCGASQDLWLFQSGSS